MWQFFRDTTNGHPDSHRHLRQNCLGGDIYVAVGHPIPELLSHPGRRPFFPGTRFCRGLTAAIIAGMLFGGPQSRGQSLNQLLNNAPTTQPPSAKLTPDTRPGFNPLQPVHTQAQFNRRPGRVVLSNGKAFAGTISTTVDTPFRIWISAIKRYRDIPLLRIRRMDVKILAHREIRQWRYLQNGSDIKVYSGKTQPWFRFAYTFTLLHGQKITGTVVAPVYLQAHGHTYSFLIYKHLEGKIGEPVKEVVYIQKIVLKVTPAILAARKKMTHQLPLVSWRSLAR